MPNPFCFAELHTNDTDKAKKFYGGLFDWKLNDVQMGDMSFAFIEVGEGTGGMMKNPVAGAPSHWMAYVRVDDLRGATKKAKALGGAIVRDGTEIPDYGWRSIIPDPTGATLGLWQSKRA